MDNTPKYTVNNEQKTQAKPIEKTNNISNMKVGSGIKGWPKIVTDLKQEGKIMLYTNLVNSTANEINDMTVGISFPKGLTPFGKTILEKSENISEIEKRVSMEFGKPMRIKYMDSSNNEQKQNIKEETQLESFAQDLDLPFNVIE